MNGDDTRLDGNAAAGLLGELFALDVTVASVTCGGCGDAAPMGEARVYGGTMGAILHCARCGTVVLRFARTPAGYWLDMRGARSFCVKPATEATPLGRRGK